MCNGVDQRLADTGGPVGFIDAHSLEETGKGAGDTGFLVQIGREEGQPGHTAFRFGYEQGILLAKGRRAIEYAIDE